MHLLSFLPVCLFAFFGSASSLFSQLPSGQFDITRYYLQAAAWMFLAMPALLCFPMDSMLVTLSHGSAYKIKISIASKFGNMGPSISTVIATCYHGGSTGCFPILNMMLFCDEVGIRELVVSMCMLNIGLQCSTAAICLPYNEIL